MKHNAVDFFFALSLRNLAILTLIPMHCYVVAHVRHANKHPSLQMFREFPKICKSFRKFANIYKPLETKVSMYLQISRDNRRILDSQDSMLHSHTYFLRIAYIRNYGIFYSN